MCGVIVVMNVLLFDVLIVNEVFWCGFKCWGVLCMCVYGVFV